jgi:hypothetical protein
LNNTSRIPDSHEEYVDSALAILERAWDQQVGDLGYDAPPSDGGKGGGPEYDFYILSQPVGTFAETIWEDDDLVSASPNERYATYTLIDNDYLGYRTPGLDGLRISCVHDFFHAIQIGSYGLWNTPTKSDLYFYELTSTWMEEVLYDDVDDYLFEVTDYLTTATGRGFRNFRNQALSFTTYGFPWGYKGYERCLFAVFLEAKFGRSAIRDIWSGMKTEPFLQAIDAALKRRGTDFAREYAWFGFWNYYTADRADTLRYYPEGHLYPRIEPHVRMPYNGFYATIASEGMPLSEQHFEFFGGGDTIHAAIVNTNTAGGSSANSVPASLGLTASNTEQGGMKQVLSDGTYMSLMVERSPDWRTLYLLTSTATDARASGAASPNPLSLGRMPVLTLPVDETSGPTASVWILSPSLDLVYSRDFPVEDQFGRRVVLISSTELQSSISTGIHFVVVRVGDKEFTWKVAIVQ